MKSRSTDHDTVGLGDRHCLEEEVKNGERSRFQEVGLGRIIERKYNGIGGIYYD
jgi:hypothetical protein